MKNRFVKASLASLLALGAVTFSSCDEETLAAIDEILGLNQEGGYYSGYIWDNENLEEIEDDINLAAIYGNGSLPSKVDLTNYLPPIGDQGQYGTCVAWATAYNCRTFLNAKSKGLSKSQLSSTSNQFSPKDIFLSIPNSQKGSDCGGTSFEAAFDKMVSRGVATMDNQPYQGLGSCSQSASSSSNAGSYKIKSYREIKVDAQTIKQYLAEGKLVVFGAELGDEFMISDGSTILTRQTSFNQTGQHAYHAMVLSGYDDSKGTNGAFRVVNSWGTGWGDNGYIWVDQKFFCGGKFCYSAFVAYDQNEDNNKVQVDDQNQVVNQSDGYDLISTELDFYKADYEDGVQWYGCDYDVFNAGNKAISASNNWGICLLYYNAYNAEDLGVVLLDLYTDAYGKKGDMVGSWDEKDAYAFTGVPAAGYAWNNIDVKAGQNVGEACGGSAGFTWEFNFSENKLNGSYYLVLAADAFDDISESNEDNNYLFATDQPIKFVNGVPTNLSSLSKSFRSQGKTFRQNDPSPLQDVRTADNVNAYTPEEVMALVRAHKKNGTIAKMAREWMGAQKETTRPRRINK